VKGEKEVSISGRGMDLHVAEALVSGTETGSVK